MIKEFLSSYFMRTVTWARDQPMTTKIKALSFEKATIVKTKPSGRLKAATTQTKAQTEFNQRLKVSLIETIQTCSGGVLRACRMYGNNQQNFHEHSFATLNSASFGTHFVKTKWPILERYGVQVSNPNRRPRRYEMTAEAKQKPEAILD
jgi:hypothetical protein